MYGNYTLDAYDDKWNLQQEFHFEQVTIEYKDNMVFVISEHGKLLYAISTNRCTVIVTEDTDA